LETYTLHETAGIPLQKLDELLHVRLVSSEMKILAELESLLPEWRGRQAQIEFASGRSGMNAATEPNSR
jgi:hypothetical protein